MTAPTQNAIKFGMSDMNPTNIFISVFEDEFKATPSTPTTELESIAVSLKDDLSDTSLGYFSNEDWAKIAGLAAKRLAEFANNNDESLQASWHKVLREFHGQSNWGFRKQSSKPKVVRPPEATDGMGWYLWAVFQPMTITKVAILYFGAKVAADTNDTSSKIYLSLAVLYMFLSLGYFAWRQNKKNNNAK